MSNVKEFVSNLPARRELRASIYAMQEALQSLPAKEHIDFDTRLTHHFAPGVYVREIRMKAGETIVGKIHKTKHVSIVSQGKAMVTTESGGATLIEAPCTFINEPGDKRALHILEDMVWTTIHPTNETNIAVLERDLVAETYEELE